MDYLYLFIRSHLLFKILYCDFFFFYSALVKSAFGQKIQMWYLRKRVSFRIDSKLTSCKMWRLILLLLWSPIQIPRSILNSYQKKTAQHRTWILNYYEVWFALLILCLLKIFCFIYVFYLGFWSQENYCQIQRIQRNW